MKVNRFPIPIFTKVSLFKEKRENKVKKIRKIRKKTKTLNGVFSIAFDGWSLGLFFFFFCFFLIRLYLPIFLQMIQIRSLLISVSGDLEPLYNLCKMKRKTKWLILVNFVFCLRLNRTTMYSRELILFWPADYSYALLTNNGLNLLQCEETSVFVSPKIFGLVLIHK